MSGTHKTKKSILKFTDKRKKARSNQASKSGKEEKEELGVRAPS